MAECFELHLSDSVSERVEAIEGNLDKPDEADFYGEDGDVLLKVMHESLGVHQLCGQQALKATT